MRLTSKESDILKACLDLLAAKRILAFRMNTGGFRNGKHVVKYGVRGMADILAFAPISAFGVIQMIPVWIECKTEIGQQSAEQKSFELQVIEHRHSYLLARSVDDLEHWLSERGV